MENEAESAQTFQRSEMEYERTDSCSYTIVKKGEDNNRTSECRGFLFYFKHPHISVNMLE